MRISPAIELFAQQARQHTAQMILPAEEHRNHIEALRSEVRDEVEDCAALCHTTQIWRDIRAERTLMRRVGQPLHVVLDSANASGGALKRFRRSLAQRRIGVDEVLEDLREIVVGSLGSPDRRPLPAFRGHALFASARSWPRSAHAPRSCR